MEPTGQPNAHVPSPTSTAEFSEILNYLSESNRPIREQTASSNASISPSLDTWAVSRMHFDELRRYLADDLAKPPENLFKKKLTQLTQQQFQKLSTDVCDNLVRRKNSKEDEVPPLLVRDAFDPKRNQAYQKLAAFPTPNFRDLCRDVYFDLTRRYPEFQKSNNNVPSLGFSSSRSTQAHALEWSSEDNLDSGYGGSSSGGNNGSGASGGSSAAEQAVAMTHFEELRQYLTTYLEGGIEMKRICGRTFQITVDWTTEAYEIDKAAVSELNSTKGAVPFLPARSEFDMQRNQARQKLATMPASKFEGRCIDIYFELAWRYPRVLRESDVVHTFNRPSSLDVALSNLNTEICPLENPADWLRSDTEHVNSIVRDLVTPTAGVEIEEANISGIMIYKRLIIYIFAHLILCTSDKRLLSDFKKSLQRWKAWDHLTVVENHQTIRNDLQSLYRRGREPHHNLHSGTILNKLLTLGDIGLCAHLAVMVSNTDQYKQVLSQRGPGAQALLNLLQARLNHPINSAYKPRHLKALIRLSGASGLYPECLVLKGVEIEAHPVAGGSFGDIFKGRLLDQNIAVKVLRVYQKSDIDIILQRFSSEAVVWRQLSHANVLPFYGIYHLDSRPGVCMACPWMDNGTIVQFLVNCTSDVDRTLLCLDVAHGLEYLHSENVIHGDLKGLNILVSPSQRACISDFGLATAMHSASTAMMHTTMTCTRGTPRWQAPELLPDMTNADASITECHNTKATDVYAFALVCFEIFSGKYPFYDIPNDFQVAVAVQQGKRPARPSFNMSLTNSLTDQVWSLIETCWTKEPSKRPTASQIAKQLRTLPDRPADQRPLDNFNMTFSSQFQCKEFHSPFSTLTNGMDNKYTPSITLDEDRPLDVH